MVLLSEKDILEEDYIKVEVGHRMSGDEVRSRQLLSSNQG